MCVPLEQLEYTWLKIEETPLKILTDRLVFFSAPLIFVFANELQKVCLGSVLDIFRLEFL